MFIFVILTCSQNCEFVEIYDNVTYKVICEMLHNVNKNLKQFKIVCLYTCIKISPRGLSVLVAGICRVVCSYTISNLRCHL